MRSMSALALIVAAALWSPLAGATREVALGVDGRVNATPWIAAAGDFVAVAWGGRAPSGATDVYVAISRDAGLTFGPPVQVNTRPGDGRLGGEIPPRVALTRRSAGADPQVIVLWNAKAGGHTEIQIARSEDGGRSFAAGIALQAPGAAGDRGWQSLAVDAEGKAHAMWLDHRGLAEPATAHEHAGHDAAAAAGDKRDGVAMAQKSGLYYAASGGSPSPERELAKGVCYCCKTALVAGAPGTLFAAWRQVYAGNMRDIAFAQSRDNGKTFTAPVRISDDQWQLDGCPDDGPAMAVDASNTVHIAWPTVIGGPTPEGAIFYASTRDGRTFTPRQRVPTLGSPKPSHPQIVVDARGQVFVAWDESRNGMRTAAVRRLTLAGGKAVFGEPQILSGATAGTYPVMAATSTGLLAAWTSTAADRSAIVVTRLDGATGATAR